MLKWDEADLISFFGVAGVFDKPCHSYSYEVTGDGIRLLVTIFDLEQAVYVSIFRDGLSVPLFTVCRELCTHVQIVKDEASRDCFQAGSPKHPVSDPKMQPVLVRGVRVYVKPHFRVQLIEDRYT